MLDGVTKGYLTLRPASAARTLSRMHSRDIEAAFESMPRQLAAGVLEYMAPASASRCLLQLPKVTAAEILAHTPILAAVSALRVMERQQVQELLALIPRPVAARLRLRLRFSESVVGAFVDEDVLTLSPTHRVGDALRLYRQSGHRTGQMIPVLDEKRHLLAVIDLYDLLGNTDRRLVQHLMRPPDHVLVGRTTLQTVTNHPAWLHHDSLPVVSRNGIFQGVLRRSRVTEEGPQLLSEVAEHNDLISTRAALADIFWIAVGALFVGHASRADRSQRET
ncbi:MAG: CBS domain-containing protein [Sedimenticolaceae bacterium]